MLSSLTPSIENNIPNTTHKNCRHCVQKKFAWKLLENDLKCLFISVPNIIIFWTFWTVLKWLEMLVFLSFLLYMGTDILMLGALKRGLPFFIQGESEINYFNWGYEIWKKQGIFLWCVPVNDEQQSVKDQCNFKLLVTRLWWNKIDF